MLDRNPVTRWQAPAGSTLTVDLGRSCTIRHWRLNLAGLVTRRMLNAAAGYIRAENTKKSMRTVATFSNNTFAWLEVPFEPTPVEARYVQLVITKGTQPKGDNMIRVQGFELYGEPCPTNPAGNP